jgi:hypothetical protein
VALVRGIFIAQVRLERREGTLHVVLKDPKQARGPTPGKVPAGPHVPTASATQHPTSAMGVDAAQLERMQAALARVLNQHAGARKVLKHLGYLEHVLRRKGASCFLSLPISVLKPALLQLGSVMGPGKPENQGLAELHACLVVTVVDRDVAPDDGESSGPLSVFNVDNKLQVRELSHTDFAMADSAWSLEEGTAS